MSKKLGTVLLLLALVLSTFTACKEPRSNAESTSGESGTGSSTTADETGNTPSEKETARAEGNSAGKTPATTLASVTVAPATVPGKEQVRVTLQEGWSFMQVANALANAGVCSQADFYEASKAYTVKSFTIPSSGNRCFRMEGYLFPDTYMFYKTEEPSEVLRKILNNYAAKSGMPSNETLILASILEKEVRSDEHMTKVSGVFHNRLNQGMKLQADSTREYVNNYITGNSLVPEQAKYAPLYNTYKCAALPAGPICNPSARAIAAAVNYQNSDYLYFFFGLDNQNHYSKTLEEHDAQIAQYGV